MGARRNRYPLSGLGGDWLSPRAVNDDGIIGGSAYTPDGKQHAVTWDASGTPKRLQEPEGYLQSIVEDINNQHVAIGTASLYSTTWAVRWDRDGKPTFQEQPLHSVGSLATRVNDNGEIIGSARFAGTSNTSAVRWDANGKVMYLGAGPFPSPATARTSTTAERSPATPTTRSRAATGRPGRCAAASSASWRERPTAAVPTR